MTPDQPAKLSFEERFEKELDALPDGWIVLLETNAENALNVSLAAIKVLTDKDYISIIISANRPCSNLLNLYKKSNIDTKKVFLLDCVCKNQAIEVRDSENVLHLEDVSALTNIAISINKISGKLTGNKVIFVDSITTMLIHNKPDVFARFTHSILTKMRIDGVNGLLVSLENETNKEVRAEIAQLCDKVIKISGQSE